MMKSKWNKYRQNYHKMSYVDKQNFHEEEKDRLAEVCSADMETLLDLYPAHKKKIRVLELGGANGKVAKIFIEKFKNIEMWYNIDFVSFEQFIHEKYVKLPLTDYMWNCDINKYISYDLFFSSNTFEHLTVEEIHKVMKIVSRQAKRLLIEVPLKKDEETDWTDYDGSHILRISMNKLKQILNSYGYSITLTRANCLYGYQTRRLSI